MVLENKVVPKIIPICRKMAKIKYLNEIKLFKYLRVGNLKEQAFYNKHAN